jgi:hypothetical protein
VHNIEPNWLQIVHKKDLEEYQKNIKLNLLYFMAEEDRLGVVEVRFMQHYFRNLPEL